MAKNIRKILLGSVGGIMGIWFIGGLALFPDNPIHRCVEGGDYLYSRHPNGYCGKQDQPHTALDFRNFLIWQRIGSLLWPSGMAAILFLQARREPAGVAPALKAKADGHSTAPIPHERPRPIVLSSRFSPQLCALRLQGVLGGTRVVGYANERHAFLLKSRYQSVLGERVLWRNSFRPCLWVKLKATPAGTSMLCRSGMHPSVLGFLAIWFGGLILIASRLVIAGDAVMHRTLALGFIATLFGCGAGIVWMGRKLAKGEVEYLVDVVAEATEARLTSA